MDSPVSASAHQATASPPPHLEDWTLPPGWSWGADALLWDTRHYQEVVDALGRSLSLVSVPDPAHHEWLHNEARALAHRNHPSIPTTYHYWASYTESRRGPGYLRRWISGETVGSRVSRLGPQPVAVVLQILREAGSTLAYLHDSGVPHGAISSETVWLTPGGRLWLLGWEWAMPREHIPAGAAPKRAYTPTPPEWQDDEWSPTYATDQWQLGSVLYTAVTGKRAPCDGCAPDDMIHTACPKTLSNAIARALDPDPSKRFETIASLLRQVDKGIAVRTVIVEPEGDVHAADSAEARLRWATGDDYEILAPLGKGMYGSVWRARDLSLEREVAIKMLHPHIASDDRAVSRFRREAKLAAQLAHPNIVPIYDSDSHGDVVWYTMELAEGGSVASLVARRGPRKLEEIAPQVDDLLEALIVAHAAGVIHRDLKPENILIDRYRRWRIGDFGIAFAVGEGRAGASGTPAFAAPEQLLGESQGPATDCYALASIVFFVLTGEPPFGEGRSEQVLAQQLSNRLADRIEGAGFPDPLAEWLLRGLSPRVEDRFADAEDMQQEWRRVIREVRDEHRPWWRRIIEGPSLADESFSAG